MTTLAIIDALAVCAELQRIEICLLKFNAGQTAPLPDAQQRLIDQAMSIAARLAVTMTPPTDIPQAELDAILRAVFRGNGGAPDKPH